MIALYIIGAVLLILTAVLFLPVSIHLVFVEDFFVKIKFAGIKVYEIKPDGEDKEKNQKKDSTEKEEKQENPATKEGKQLFGFLKEKHGFTGAVKSLLGLLGDVLTHIKKLLRHIKIKRVELKLTVAADDAAQTAIEYGTVCAAAYPVLALLDSCAEVGFKNIDIKSDFNSGKPDFSFSATVRMQIFFLLSAAFGIYTEYKNFTLKENYNERK